MRCTWWRKLLKEGSTKTESKCEKSGSPPKLFYTLFDNGSGFLEIVTANSTSNDVSILLGNGDGDFRDQQRFAAGDFPQSVAVGDLSGDTLLNIVTANGRSNDVSVLFGNGDGTFQSAQAFATGGQDPVSVTVVDLNGDGLLDLAVGNNSIPTYNGVSVLLHQ
jgi:hypothetical protein